MIEEIVDVQHRQTARSILDLCVHTLSPAGHGATLVWFPRGAPGSTEHLDLAVAIPPPALSAADPTHAQAIAHALGQLDRAVVVDSDGTLVHLNVTLGHADAHSTLSFHGGTRHNSAGRYSASDHRPLVFVVSADGPVTVLREGRVIASTP
jgi:DNA integrity scanning protein DisA with diadenylate cyclase activity